MIYNQKKKKTSNQRVKNETKNNMTAGREKLCWMNDEIPLSLSPTGTATPSPPKMPRYGTERLAHYLSRYERREDEPQHGGGVRKEQKCPTRRWKNFFFNWDSN